MTRDARPESGSTGRGRALLALGAAAAVAGAIVVIVAIRSGADPDAATLVTEETVVETLPSTVPPRVTVSTAASATPTPSPAGDDTDDEGRSPLAALLGEQGSAIPPDIEPRPRPVGLTIDDIFVDDPVRPVGLEDDGQLEVPDETEIGWYRYGSAPGFEGATVLAAHVTWNGEYGPFLNLGSLALGELIDVTLDDGTTRTYEVIERAMYGKQELPRERIWRTTGDETLVLITCGGDFNPEINRYRENIVVYAVPVA